MGIRLSVMLNVVGNFILSLSNIFSPAELNKLKLDISNPSFISFGMPDLLSAFQNPFVNSNQYPFSSVTISHKDKYITLMLI